ncbi:cobalamin biosynthesis protein [Solirubrobacter soli]|uniref:cobalamin biosynthesis protein n=1 Tax=Solirubrobacter soli TaxID=363832 RepID=UPI001B7FA715|nr:cobalamin biosynthesis protein [Solirubrobacter soli]
MRGAVPAGAAAAPEPGVAPAGAAGRVAARTRGVTRFARETPVSAGSCGFVHVWARETSTRVHSGARLVVGAGCSLGCAPEELAALVDETLDGLDGIVVAVASVDRRSTEPCVVALAERFGVPLRTFGAAELKRVVVPTPSPVVLTHVGTPSVAEAAALLATRGSLIVPKRRSAHATCAIAEESR